MTCSPPSRRMKHASVPCSSTTAESIAAGPTATPSSCFYNSRRSNTGRPRFGDRNLRALTHEDFVRILTEPEASLIRQYTALMNTEDVTLEFTGEAIEEIARLSADINSGVENIGARRLHTVMERLLEEISFTATDRGGETIVIDADMVRERVGELLKNADLTKFIL